METFALTTIENGGAIGVVLDRIIADKEKEARMAQSEGAAWRKFLKPHKKQ